MEVYFDNSATTKPYEEAIEAMVLMMSEYYGNPSSAHMLGVKAERKLNEAREIIAATINASKEEIIFTSGGSESNNLLIQGFAKAGTHVITSSIEHPSVLETFKGLEREGTRVTYLNVDEYGRIDLEQLKSSIEKDTTLVSIMHVNNEIGTVQNIEEIGKIIREKSTRAKFHVDAVQSYGKFKIDINRIKADLLSASSHKIHGPRGAGFAYIRKGLVPRPLIYGGGQEKNMRGGTENLAAVYSFAVAAKMIHNIQKKNYEKVKRLKSYFVKRLQGIEGVKVNNEDEGIYTPYILNVSFVGIRAEVLLHALEEKGIFVSIGSACSARGEKDSYVLKAIGIKELYLKGTLRFSFSEYNSEEEVDYTIENLLQILKILRRIRR